MATPEIEAKARAMGWVPPEEHRTPLEHPLTAEEFVERGETLVPFLRANNRKLEESQARLQEDNKRLAQLFAASQESITALQTFHEEATAQAVEKAKRDLRRELIEARQEGDVERELEVQEQLDELRAPPRVAKPAPAPAPVTPQVDPAMAAWMQENPWFNTDARKTNLAIGIANQLRADPDNDGLQGRAFFDKVSEVMVERQQPGGPAKVSGGRPSGQGGAMSGGSRDYASLPSDAKAACERQARSLVGEGRAFKDAASWQAYYAKEYYRGEDK